MFIKNILMLLLAMSFSANIFAQEQRLQQSTSMDRGDFVQRDIGRLQEANETLKLRVSRSEERIEDLSQTIDRTTYSVMGLVALLLAYGVGIFAYVRSSISRSVSDIAKELMSQAEKKMMDKQNTVIRKFESDLSTSGAEILKSVEGKHFKYMQVTSLRYAEQYDAAIEHAGWKGDFRSFTNEPDAYQRTLIICLSQSNKARINDSHLEAWGWIKSLAERSPNYQNLSTMLRVGITVKHFLESVELYDGYCNCLGEEDRSRCEPMLFVAIRRARNPKNTDALTNRLNKLAAKHRNTKDLKFTTNMSAFYRDEGRFEDAHRLMNFHVNRLTGSAVAEDGWERLFNTLILQTA